MTQHPVEPLAASGASARSSRTLQYFTLTCALLQVARPGHVVFYPSFRFRVPLQQSSPFGAFLLELQGLWTATTVYRRTPQVSLQLLYQAKGVPTLIAYTARPRTRAPLYTGPCPRVFPPSGLLFYPLGRASWLLFETC